MNAEKQAAKWETAAIASRTASNLGAVLGGSHRQRMSAAWGQSRAAAGLRAARKAVQQFQEEAGETSAQYMWAVEADEGAARSGPVVGAGDADTMCGCGLGRPDTSLDAGVDAPVPPPASQPSRAAQWWDEAGTADRLAHAVDFLAREHLYCPWCAATYPDEATMAAQCPGREEDQH